MTFYNFINPFLSNVKRFWLVLLIVLVLIASVLFYSKVLLLETIHLSFFPVIAFLVWFIPKSSKYRMPNILFFFCILGWGIGYLDLYEGFRQVTTLNGVIFSKLSEDEEEIEVRSLMRRYKEIATAYKAPYSKYFHREFKTNEEARRFLQKYKEVDVLVYKDAFWPSLIIRNQISSSSNLKVLENQKLAEVKISEGESLFLILDVGEVRFSYEPRDLFLHVLVWFSKATKSKTSFSLKKSYFREAGAVIGHWKSNSLKSLSEFLLANLILSYEINKKEEDVSKGSLKCSIRAFKRAAGLLKGSGEFNLLASIFNNAAVAQVKFSRSYKSIRRAKKWLIKASNIRNKDNSAPEASIISMRNLRILDKNY